MICGTVLIVGALSCEPSPERFARVAIYSPIENVQKPTSGKSKSKGKSESIKKVKHEPKTTVLAYASAKTPAFPKGIDLSQPGYKAVVEAAKEHGIPKELALRVAHQESKGKCNAKSSANAMGVMQVIPATARKHGLTKAKKLYNCKTGADVGMRELKKQLNENGGDVVKALIGYNCGPDCIGRKRLPKETREYVRIITGKKL